jgi:hypothetical protein
MDMVWSVVDEEGYLMSEEQPDIVLPKHLQLPQISPQQLAEARHRFLPVTAKQPIVWQPTPPEVTPAPDWQRTPQPSMPQHSSYIETRAPNTPPLLEAQNAMTSISYPVPQRQDTPLPGGPILRYIPATFRHKEIGVGEALLGCVILVAVTTLVLVLLYYLSLPG